MKQTDAELLFKLVHSHAALAESVAHTNSPKVRNSGLLDVESFRVEADTLTRQYPALRRPVARIHLSLSELQSAAGKLTTETDWSDQQSFSDMNPCHSLWQSLQKEVAAFDEEFKARLWHR